MKQRPRKPGARVVRGRVWVEIDGKPAMTDAGADLLEQIVVCGSLSEAARRLRYMNKRGPGPLVKTATGGRRGGGASITELGRDVLAIYRDLQLQVEHTLDSAGDPFKSLS
jgi:molybdate transport system regulatory protein